MPPVFIKRPEGEMKPFETLTNAGQLRRLRRLAAKALTAYDLDMPHLTALQHEGNSTFRVDTADGKLYIFHNTEWFHSNDGWGIAF